MILDSLPTVPTWLNWATPLALAAIMTMSAARESGRRRRASALLAAAFGVLAAEWFVSPGGDLVGFAMIASALVLTLAALWIGRDASDREVAA